MPSIGSDDSEDNVSSEEFGNSNAKNETIKNMIRQRAYKKGYHALANSENGIYKPEGSVKKITKSFYFLFFCFFWF